MTEWKKAAELEPDEEREYVLVDRDLNGELHTGMGRWRDGRWVKFDIDSDLYYADIIVGFAIPPLPDDLT